MPPIVDYFQMIPPPKTEVPPPQPDKDSPDFWTWVGKCVAPPTDWAALAGQLKDIALKAKQRGTSIMIANQTR